MPGINVYVGSSTVPSGGVDGELTTWSQIASAAAANTSSTQTFHVRAGTYTASQLSGISRTANIRFLGYPGEENSIFINSAGLDLSGCSNITFEGMRPSIVSISGCTDVKLDRVKVATDSTVSFVGHCVRCILDRFNASGGPTGSLVGIYGTVSAGNEATDCIIRRGVITGNQTGNLQDGIRIHQAVNLLVEDTEISGIDENAGATSHSDAVQIFAAGGTVNGVTFRRMYIHDNDGQGLYSDDIAVQNIVSDNNLQIRSGNGNHYFLVNGITITNNTAPGGSIGVGYRITKYAGDPNSDQNISWHHNVIENVYSDDWTWVVAHQTRRDRNLIGSTTFTTGPNSEGGSIEGTITGNGNYLDPTHTGDDYRMGSITISGQTFTPGVDWKPADIVRGCGF